MPRALFNGVVVADAEETVIVEGNHYFPPESLKLEFFSETLAHTTTCPWKGLASYYDVEVEGERAEAVAWTYKEPSERAAMIKDHVAFYPKVRIEGAPRRGLFSRK
jgi:uncharacterized protein (DUF427 family)